MSDDNHGKDRTRKKPGKSGAARPPIIDLKARPVTKPEKEGATAKKEETHGLRPGEPATGNAEGEKTPPGEQTVEKAAGKETPSNATNKTQEEKPETPPQKNADESSPKERKAPPPGSGKSGKGRKGLILVSLAIVSLLAGALAGGAWLYHRYGPEKQIAQLQQRLQALRASLHEEPSPATLQTRIETLQKQLAALKKAQDILATEMRELSKSDGGALPKQLRALQRKVAALQAWDARITANTGAIATLKKAQRRMEAQLTILKQGISRLASTAPAADGKTATADSAALVALKLALQDLKQRLQATREELAAIKEAADPTRMRLLQTRLKKVEEALARTAGELRGDGEALKARLTALAREVKAVRAEMQAFKEHPPQPKVAPPPQALAYAALRTRVKSGAPYQDELKRLAALMPAISMLDTLAPYAEQGLPTPATLRRRLEELLRKLRKAQQRSQKPPAGALDMLKQRLLHVVKVRRAGEVDWPALLKEALRSFDRGGLAAAVATLAPHERQMPPDIAEWLKRAKARLKADEALDALAEKVLSAETVKMKK